MLKQHIIFFVLISEKPKILFRSIYISILFQSQVLYLSEKQLINTQIL